MDNWFLRRGRILEGTGFVERDLVISGGMITALGENLRASEDAIVYDAKGRLISPGFIDLHVHLREPGFPDKETIRTGTLAAARGGFTTLCAMPNTSPALDSKETIEDFQKRCEKEAKVQVLTIGALSKNRGGVHLVDFSSLHALGVRLFSDDGDGLSDLLAKEAMLGIYKVGGVLINHLEEKSLVKEGFFHDSIPKESETKMLVRDLKLVKETGCAYHAAHLSCKESVDLIRRAKKEGLPVTAEVTPHHLVLTYQDIKSPKENYVMKPPLRGEQDKEALLQGLLDGTIDCVATDHAPHGRSKSHPWPFGIIGLETAFALLYTKLVLTKKMGLPRLLESLTTSPARILQSTASLAVGQAAHVTVLDLERKEIQTSTTLLSKGKNSPFLGEELWGHPVLTLQQGRLVYSRND